MDNFTFFQMFMAPRNPENVTDLEWFEQFYSDFGNSDRQNCLNLVYKTNSMLATFNFVLIDKLLKDMDVKRLTVLIMVGVLRYVCCVKEKLPNWKDLFKEFMMN